MTMNPVDWLMIVHPTLSVALIFPLLGIVVRYAWQTRQRRLRQGGGGPGSIPATAGPDHVRLGRWLAYGVVGVTLVAYGFILFVWKFNVLDGQLWGDRGGIFALQLALMGVTVGSMALLTRSRSRLWRIVFAALASLGVLVLGGQEGVYHRSEEWYISHYYYGVAVAILMIGSIAITPEIYRDRTHRWRIAHSLINALALLLFIGQGLTGSRDLLEISLSWQTPVINAQCDWANKTCTVPEAPPNP
ncbi:MAG: DUF4079 domain-containing protein [Cyanobacteria bacterium]|nr:DUF4079 domain-containing protein [Cyanobacteriota bacterium]